MLILLWLLRSMPEILISMYRDNRDNIDSCSKYTEDEMVSVVGGFLWVVLIGSGQSSASAWLTMSDQRRGLVMGRQAVDHRPATDHAGDITGRWLTGCHAHGIFQQNGRLRFLLSSLIATLYDVIKARLWRQQRDNVSSNQRLSSSFICKVCDNRWRHGMMMVMKMMMISRSPSISRQF